MRDRGLKTLAKWQSKSPWIIISVVFFISLFFIYFAGHLKVTMRWSDLLPSRDQRTIQFNKIIEEFKAATSLVVVLQGDEQRIKKFADEIAPIILNAEMENANNKSKLKLFRRIDYKTETDFLKKYGLLLIKEDDLINIKDIFLSPNFKDFLFNLNNSLEKEYVGRQESISTREKEDQAFQMLDAVQYLMETIQFSLDFGEISHKKVNKTIDKFLYGEPYFLSYDKKALILNAVPNFSMTDAELMVKGTDAVQAILDENLKNYPNINAGLTGMIAIGRDEMVYSEKSLNITTIIAVIAIMAMLILALRMWVAPLLAIINLLIGIIWASGAAALAVGQLNIMTMMMAVILLGLGIDFSIHLISGFIEERAQGKDINTSLENTYLKSGKGIITGALTTACAFYTLSISQSRGLKEMGIVTGTGLIAILVSTFLLLPVLLVFRERHIDKKSHKKTYGQVRNHIQRDISFRFLGSAGHWLSSKYRLAIIISILLSFFLLWQGTKITFDYNYMNIEPKGLTSIKLQDTVLEKFDLGMDYALVLTDSPSRSRELSQQYRNLGTVATSEDLSLYLPSPQQQQNRIPHIQDIIRSMESSMIYEAIYPEDLPIIKQEIDRLQMNVMEIQDMAFLGGQDKVDNKCKKIVGDPDNPDSKNIIKDLLFSLQENESKIISLSLLQKYFAPYFKESVIKMGTMEALNLEDLPDSILDRYSNENRTHFLVTVFPAGNIWQNAQFLNRFVTDLEAVSDKATGMPPVFRALIEIIGRDGRNAALLTLVIVFVLLVIDFRSPILALLAMVPLGLGFIWMLGFMRLTGMQLTVMNVMGLPMILGIGIDDGVHLIHRWRHEGKGKIKVVFSSTGKAILLTSLTTMLAFGSLVFSIWRGFAQLGGALFLGVGACFLTSVIVLAGILGFIERKESN